MRDINLSIIIPHYNSPKTLEVLLDSIFECNPDKVEAIVVDDNSDKYLEEYRECKKKFLDCNVHFFVNDTGKKSAGASRNVGIENATGKWILFADADDYFVNSWFDIVSEYFCENLDVVFFLPTSKNLKTGKQGVREIPYVTRINEYLSKNQGAEARLRYEFNVPWSKLIRKSLIDQNKIRFDSTRYSNDVMFSAKIGYHLKSFIVDERTIYCVTEGENTLTKSMSESTYYIRTEVFINKYIYLKDRLSKEEWESIPTKNEPLKYLYKVIQRKYGLKTLLKYIKLYHVKNIPIITRYTFLIPFKGM
ncbi:MAG: glycosyltransferase family 2 protein [Oscillospiraceae bacterium]|nr:glycosyltransferase family 2 protein [Oscillospiraceae bacterium]